MIRRGSTGGGPPRKHLNGVYDRPAKDSDLANKFCFVIEAIRFKDHQEQACISCYTGWIIPALDQVAIVPPWSYQIHVTTGMDPESVDAVKFCRGFLKTVYEYNQGAYVNARMDFIFMQTSTTGCMRHYINEKQSVRQEGIYFIVPTYASHTSPTDSLLVVLDHEEYKTGGVQWCPFNTSDISEGDGPIVRRDWTRIDVLGREEDECMNMKMYHVWEESTARAKLEKEYRLAKDVQDEVFQDWWTLKW